MELMFKPDLLKGKRILVTGGGTGLGEVMAEAYAQLGAAVYICGRRKEVLDETAKRISGETGAAVKGIACDIRVAEAVEDTIAQIWEDGGALTGLVNNAAGNFISRTKDLSPRGFNAIADIVFRGSFYMTLACGKRWIEAGDKGSVISILTTWIWNGGPFTVPSAMSKAGLNVMTKSLATEWGPNGIRLNAIAPGPFPTKGAWDRLSPAIGRSRHGPRQRHSHGPQWRDAGTGKPRRVPDGGRLRLSDGPDHRHRRRAASGLGRQFRQPVGAGRCGLGAHPRRDQIRQREGQGEAGGLASQRITCRPEPP